MRGNIIQEIVVVILMFFPSVVFANKPPDDVQKAKILKKTYRMQIPFIENKGQIENKAVGFYAKTFGGTLFVEKNGTLTYSLPAKDKGGVVIKEVFTEKSITVKGLEPSPTKVNYFKGEDKNKWRSNIPSYNSISLGEVYKGIGLKLKACGNNVEKLFTVLPGENPKIIKVKLIGGKGLKVNKNGELEVLTDFGSLKFTKPIAYQMTGDKKQFVEVAYGIHKGTTYGFKVGSYDKKRQLIIDPLLSSTFIGGNLPDLGWSIALDGSGDVYVTGDTTSPDYPTTPGAYDESYNYDYNYDDAPHDVFVSKLDSSLSTLLASTFIGGNSMDSGHSIALDGSGNVYVTGKTESSNYPTTSGAYNEDHHFSHHVFVSKLDSSLSTLLASTFIGADFSLYIALDGSGNVYVTGEAGSDYPTTSGAYDESHNGGWLDVFVSKLDSSLSTLLASTFIGGSGFERPVSIALDGSGNVYVTGRTDSSDYPTTSGAYDESYNGGYYDVFVSKLDSTLSSLLASTLIGGDDFDNGNSIALGGDGNVYITGMTESSDYPATFGAYDEDYYYNDVFVSKFNSSLSSLLASTFIGGSDYYRDLGNSIALDGSGNVYVTGFTYSPDYPTTPGAYDQSHNGGGADVFVSKLNGNLNFLLASTFIGGGTWDEGSSIALDGSGDVYVTGHTTSPDYPTTPGAYDEDYGSAEAYVSKFNLFPGILRTTTTTISSSSTTITTDTSTTTTYEEICKIKLLYDENSVEVELLRKFRDNILSQTPEGQEIIRLYYQWSPAIVKAMKEDEVFKAEVKGMVNGVLELIGEIK